MIKKNDQIKAIKTVNKRRNMKKKKSRIRDVREEQGQYR
jgi:hypothetical protein